VLAADDRACGKGGKKSRQRGRAGAKLQNALAMP